MSGSKAYYRRKFAEAPHQFDIPEPPSAWVLCSLALHPEAIMHLFGGVQKAVAKFVHLYATSLGNGSALVTRLAFPIGKLRVIHSFEADYNLVVGLIFGCRALYSGVENHRLHPSQWAQPGRQCSNVVIMRDLTLGVSKMTKTPLAGFENDASACYDRIVMNLVSAVFDRMGVPPGPIRLQAETLHRVVHYLKTGFGTTTASYTSDATRWRPDLGTTYLDLRRALATRKVCLLDSLLEILRRRSRIFNVERRIRRSLYAPHNWGLRLTTRGHTARPRRAVQDPWNSQDSVRLPEGIGHRNEKEE